MRSQGFGPGDVQRVLPNLFEKPHNWQCEELSTSCYLIKICICICIHTFHFAKIKYVKGVILLPHSAFFFFFSIFNSFHHMFFGFDWTLTDICLSFSGIHFFTTKTSQNQRKAEVDRDLWRLPNPTHLLKASSIRAGCPELRPVRCWISPQMETAQHLSATYSCVWPPSH